MMHLIINDQTYLYTVLLQITYNVDNIKYIWVDSLLIKNLDLDKKSW